MLKAIARVPLSLFQILPKGTIWQTRYICLPLSLIASTLVLSNSPLPLGLRLPLFILGLLTWTFLEYVLHRWVLHAHPQNQNLRAFLDGIHILHHKNPKNDKIVCISAPNCVILWTILFTVFWIFFGLQVSLTLTSGIALMMVIYDITHYSTHYMPPTNWLLKKLRQQHMKHHFSNDTKYFGVTSPFWDYVFGTH